MASCLSRSHRAVTRALVIRGRSLGLDAQLWRLSSSYALRATADNPLNLTDPSGYSWLGDVWHKAKDWVSENWRTVVSIGVGAVLMFTPDGQAFLGGIAGIVAPGVAAGTTWGVGALAVDAALAVGGFNAALAGGNMGDILRGMTVGAIQGGISGGVLHGWGRAPQTWQRLRHIAGHGVLGGATNEAMGGKFQDGFLSAAVGATAGHMGVYEATAGTGVAGRTAMAGVVGGTASAIGGGKFANGAWTAAFQHLLNGEFPKRLTQWARNRHTGVRAVFDNKTGKLTVTSNLSGEEIVVNAKSGGVFDQFGKFASDSGKAIPKGQYWISRHVVTAANGSDRWFNLLSNDDGVVDDIRGATNWWTERMIGCGLAVLARGNFRLHLGTISTGCITAFVGSSLTISNYNAMANLIVSSGSYRISTNYLNQSQRSVYGTLFVR